MARNNCLFVVVAVFWEGSCFGFFRPKQSAFFKITPAVINYDCRILFWEDSCPVVNFSLYVNKGIQKLIK